MFSFFPGLTSLFVRRRRKKSRAGGTRFVGIFALIRCPYATELFLSFPQTREFSKGKGEEEETSRKEGERKTDIVGLGPKESPPPQASMSEVSN